jgi:ribosome-associated protein
VYALQLLAGGRDGWRFVDSEHTGGCKKKQPDFHKEIYLIVVRYQLGGCYLGRAKKLQQPEPFWLSAVHAAESKQARDIVVLDVREVTSFADYFIICTGANTRQIQAIADEIESQLKKDGETPNSVEGYGNAEWVLVDYGDYLIHIFSDKARTYYDLERLWRDGKVVKW